MILQETRAYTSCMALAYAAMYEQAMQHATNNGGPASLSLLLYSVVILLDGDIQVMMCALPALSSVMGDT